MSDEQRQPWARESGGSSMQVFASSPLPIKAHDPVPVTVVDIRMPFGSMVAFMVKWTLASIPAFVILFFIGVAFYVVLFTVVQRFVP